MAKRLTPNKNNEPKKAEEKFLEANKIAVDDLGILWGMAASIGQQGDLKRAIDWYLRIIDKYPGYHRARMTVAYVYEQLEEEAKAIAQYQAVSLAQGVVPDLKKSAEARMDYLPRQLNGFSDSVALFVDGFNLICFCLAFTFSFKSLVSTPSSMGEY